MILTDLDWSLILPALAAGILVLTTHVPLGQEVLKRGIIFIDLAIAQMAALGVMAATILLGDVHGLWLQVIAAGSALGASVLVLWLEKRYPHVVEALIGLLFILAASGGILLVSHAPHSDELLHDLLVGQILWVTTEQLLWVAGLYLLLLTVWFGLGQNRSWLFYLVFSLAVTASVQLVGVYLVFASLILPALASRTLADSGSRLFTGYLVGLLGYISGLMMALMLDVPMGAMTVWTLFAVVLISKPFIGWARHGKIC
ncbi:metal ABC transporter permease [Methylophaga sp. OBS4]|uniref:metal ABC transporter permease n=1 Tax=Methylophaga sp. OBS4 TaxID=2991935 RepID=UPI00224F3C44|nr:metal ABC transporter permease [Methylophaga sp. OBS4]MCX4188535.1 metal ABC transporter permease [Methylophaga sp. OBS4]